MINPVDMGSVLTDPLNPLHTGFGSRMGNRITPCDISKSIDWYIHQNPSKTLGT